MSTHPFFTIAVSFFAGVITTALLYHFFSTKVAAEVAKLKAAGTAVKAAL